MAARLIETMVAGRLRLIPAAQNTIPSTAPIPPWQVASNDGSGQKALDLYSCCCVTGYGMVPLILVSAALLLVPK